VTDRNSAHASCVLDNWLEGDLLEASLVMLLLPKYNGTPCTMLQQENKGGTIGRSKSEWAECPFCLVPSLRSLPLELPVSYHEPWPKKNGGVPLSSEGVLLYLHVL